MDNKSVNEMSSPLEFIFDIGDDVSTLKGIVIGGTNAALDDCTEEQVAMRIGNEIEIVSDLPTRRFRVLDITVASSIANRKNIFILIPKSHEIIDIGSRVFTVDGRGWGLEVRM